MSVRAFLRTFVAAALLAAAAATLAHAEFIQQGRLLVSFDAGVSPTKLPRRGTAPIKVGFRGTFENLDASDTPALRTMEVRLSRGGRIDARRLARCPRARVGNLTGAGALRACRAALVGRGHIDTAFRFPDGRRGRAKGSLYLFNAAGGILMHVHTTQPLEGTFLIPMRVSRTGGAFATVLRARFPRLAAGYGYLTGFRMVIERRYTYKGKRLSYAVAGCPAPAGFRKVAFELARVTYRFEGGITVRNSAIRSCTAKG